MSADKSHPSAYVKHRLPGRVRLKIPQKKGDVGYFDRIAKLFANCPGITQLQLNPAAASVLICHTAETQLGNITDFAQANALFTVAEPPEESVPKPQLPIATLTSVKLGRLDESLMDFSQGRLDGRSLVLLALIGLAAHQIIQGKVMAPATTLLWYALELLREESLI